jgi:large subunit ribosomal protein L4
MKAAVFSPVGSKTDSTIDLVAGIYNVEIKNHELLKDTYLAYLSNGRPNLAKTLSRGEVSGGGKKPWRQKGTGRARFGSSRNPIWRGGGVAFGPQGNENYHKKVNSKAKLVALKQALTLQNKDNKLIVIETFKTEGKVKDTLKLLNKLEATKNVLIIVSLYDDLVARATNNLPNVKAMQADRLNVFDLLNADTVIVSKKAVEFINGWLLGEKK